MYINHQIETALWNYRCALAEREYDFFNSRKIEAVNVTNKRHRQAVRDSLYVIEGSPITKEPIVNVFHNHQLNNWGYPNCLDNLI